jgi:hypothetical protein
MHTILTHATSKYDQSGELAPSWPQSPALLPRECRRNSDPSVGRKVAKVCCESQKTRRHDTACSNGGCTATSLGLLDRQVSCSTCIHPRGRRQTAPARLQPRHGVGLRIFRRANISDNVWKSLKLSLVASEEPPWFPQSQRQGVHAAAPGLAEETCSTQTCREAQRGSTRSCRSMAS